MKSHVTVGFGISQSPSARIAIYHFLLLLWICLTTGARAQSAPQILVQPTNQSALFFGSAVFSVQAQSAVPVSYQWDFAGQPIPNETNTELILSPLLCNQSGYYNCIVSNSFGAASSAKAELTVYQTVVAGGGPYQNFFLQFSNVTEVCEGTGYVYGLLSDGTVVGHGYSDIPLLDVPAGLSDVAAIACAEANLALQSNGTIVAWGFEPEIPTSKLTNVISVASGYFYSAVVQNNGLVVAWEDGQASPITAVFGGSNTLAVSNIIAAVPGYENEFYLLRADGAVFSWFVAGTLSQIPGISNIIALPPPGETVALNASGQLVAWNNFPTNSLINVSNAVALSAYSGSIIALNSDGTIAPALTRLFPFTLSNVFAISAIPSPTALIGDGSPVFTVQPGNQTWTNTSTIYLHARAVGVQPMAYQWQLDGTNLSSATNADLIITNAQEFDSGQYCAVASNRMGVATSRVASVTIVTLAPTNPYTLAQAFGATNLVWMTSPSYGSSNWFSEVTNTFNGIVAAQSGFTTNNGRSEARALVIGPGTLTFWWSVSSEEFFDFLNFYIGGAETNYVTQISGEVEWEQESFLIPFGPYELTWFYSKDPDVSVGEDAGWVSEVNFVPSAIQLGSPSILPNGIVQFRAFAANGTSVSLEGSLNLTFQVSSNLIDWTPLTNAVTLTNGTAQLSDPGATNAPLRFYRLVNQ